MFYYSLGHPWKGKSCQMVSCPRQHFRGVLMRFTSFTGPKNPSKHGKNAKVAKSTRVCPPTGGYCRGVKTGQFGKFVFLTPFWRVFWPSILYTEQTDAAVLGDRLLEVTQKPALGSSSLSLQCRHWESSKVLAGLAFCDMLSQYPQFAFHGILQGPPGGSAAVCDPNPPRPFARSRYPIKSL